MKQIEKLKQYKNYFVLFISIILLFIILQLLNNVSSMYVDFLGNRVKATETVLIEKNKEYYLSYKYIKDNIDDEIYFDNISKKAVISSNQGLFKVKVNDKNITVNFENNTLNNEGVIEHEDKYISLEVIKQAYNLDNTVCNNTIYLYKENESIGKVKYNNVSVHKKNKKNSGIVGYVDKKDKISVLFEKGNFVFVKINGKEVGYILKNALKYKTQENEEKEEVLKNSVYFFADSNSKHIDIDINIKGFLVDMFSITKISTEINENNINTELLNNIRKKDIKVYGMINNGYDLAGFNTTTTSQILADESKRINSINNINEKIKKYNLDGVVIDFRKLKEKDIDNYIQFIKELKAFIKKDVVVNISADEYKQYIPVINYADFSIVNAYGQRNLKSTVSGSVSEINWMKEIISNCLKSARSEKIVIGIPSYSILWTEKNSNVVDSEIYNLKAIQNYIEKNKLETKNTNGQNYAELKKGSLTYRLWLEDEYSIKNRLEIIKEKEITGIAIYKLGYENDSLIDILKNNY